VGGCPPTEMRVAAKTESGAPYEGLTVEDLHIGFRGGPAEMVSLRSFATIAGEEGVSDVLFVVPPYSGFGTPGDVSAVTATLARFDAFRFRAAVLGADGAVTGYTSRYREVAAGAGGGC